MPSMLNSQSPGKMRAEQRDLVADLHPHLAREDVADDGAAFDLVASERVRLGRTTSASRVDFEKARRDRPPCREELVGRVGILGAEPVGLRRLLDARHLRERCRRTAWGAA